MGFKKNNPGCRCCARCFDCGYMGSFDESNLTLSGFPSVLVVDSEFGGQRVRQTFTGLDTFNGVYTLTPDSECFLSIVTQSAVVTWEEEYFKATDSGGATIPTCDQTEIESTRSGSTTYFLNANQNSMTILPDAFQSEPDRPVDVNFVDVEFSASYDATLCAGDSDSTLFDAGPCGSATDFIYEAEVAPILV